jgi:hypothetical protein
MVKSKKYNFLIQRINKSIFEFKSRSNFYLGLPSISAIISNMHVIRYCRVGTIMGWNSTKEENKR